MAQLRIAFDYVMQPIVSDYECLVSDQLNAARLIGIPDELTRDRRSITLMPHLAFLKYRYAPTRDRSTHQSINNGFIKDTLTLVIDHHRLWLEAGENLTRRGFGFFQRFSTTPMIDTAKERGLLDISLPGMRGNSSASLPRSLSTSTTRSEAGLHPLIASNDRLFIRARRKPYAHSRVHATLRD